MLVNIFIIQWHPLTIQNQYQAVIRFLLRSHHLMRECLNSCFLEISTEEILSFQDMTAFSPPADSWIIRYPKSTEVNKEDMRKRVPEAQQLEDPCRKYIEGKEILISSNK